MIQMYKLDFTFANNSIYNFLFIYKIEFVFIVISGITFVLFEIHSKKKDFPLWKVLYNIYSKSMIGFDGLPSVKRRECAITK